VVVSFPAVAVVVEGVVAFQVVVVLEVEGRQLYQVLLPRVS
jgi:hypothetical protein